MLVNKSRGVLFGRFDISPLPFKPFTFLIVILQRTNLFGYEIDMERFDRFWAGEHPC